MARAKKKSGGFKVDLSKVEGRTRVPDGDYHLVVKEIEVNTDETPGYWRWKFGIKNEEGLENAVVSTITSFKPQALWNLKNLLEALGADIPDSETELDPDDYIDMECMGTIEKDGQYSNVVDYNPLDDDDKVAVEDDKPGKGKKADKKGGKKAEKDEDEDALTAEAIEEADEDELAKIVKANKLKIDLDDYPKIKKARAAVLEAATKKGLIKGDDDEKVDPDTVRNAEEDELEELIKEHELDVDLSDYKTLKKQVNAVLDALEKADKLAEED